MNNGTPSLLVRLTGCGLALAALLASVALVVFALTFAGVIGPDDGWPSMMRGPWMRMVEPDAPAAGTATPLAALEQPKAPAEPVDAAPPSGPVAPASPGAEATAGASGAGILVVDDWSGYADDRALNTAFTFNTAVPDNELELRRLGASEAPGGGAGAAAVFSITMPAPNDYVGFDRDFERVQDWSGYTHLSIDVEPSDRSARELVVQWTEGTGEVWRHRETFGDIPADGLLLIPLEPSVWEWADWSANRNQRMDLGQVISLGIYMGHTGPGAGELRLGTISLVSTGR